jgi:predicted O-linked N-acetylglucosamine transferase (SPINDLY family)
MAWFGYAGTTGVSGMDYLLADRFHVRCDEDSFFTERILRMPNGYACYRPSSDVPAVESLPALQAKQVTFGCFNNPAKFAGRIVAAWAQILNRVPGSRLYLKFEGLDDSSTKRRLGELFASCGGDNERVFLAGSSPHSELLASYGQVDLALDTQPYSGGVTTCEAMWMGVPVITFPGTTFAGRHATSHLANAGYSEFVAEDSESYIELAVSWANRVEELAIIRSQMRDRVRQSLLCDAKRFASDLLSMLNQVCA